MFVVSCVVVCCVGLGNCRMWCVVCCVLRWCSVVDARCVGALRCLFDVYCSLSVVCCLLLWCVLFVVLVVCCALLVLCCVVLAV